jgi:hypothetical protein
MQNNQHKINGVGSPTTKRVFNKPALCSFLPRFFFSEVQMLGLDMPKNVEKFIKESALEIARDAYELFCVGMECNYSRNEIMSPIEQMLYCAMERIIQLNYLVEIIDIYPQYIVDESKKYRADFKVEFTPPKGYKKKIIGRKVIAKKIANVLVECDSQQWHERTEKERRYEKARDRFFMSKGYRVFHFTGKEINDNPLVVAKEVILSIFNCLPEDLITEFNGG